MNKPVVKASELLKNLKKTKLSGDTKVFFEELVKLRDDFHLVKSKNKIMFSVEIDTDEDFLLNGKSIILEKIETSDDDFYPVFLSFFNNLSVSVHENKKSKYEHLKKLVCSEEFKKEFLLLDEAFANIELLAGNCEVKVKLLPFNSEVDLGYMTIDLE